jgi:hypothetical protein
MYRDICYRPRCGRDIADDSDHGDFSTYSLLNRAIRTLEVREVADKMSGASDEVDEKIAEVERSRRVSLWLMRLLSLATTLLVLAATGVQLTNDFLNYVPVSWWLSLPCFMVGVVDVIVEYVIRRRLPLVEGRSEHLHWVQVKIKELNVLIGRYEALRRQPGFSPEISTDNELTAILTALREHTARLTYEESTLVVTVPARCSASADA